ncbi:MAG: histidine phosphatase family protein [Caldilineaceae bacterium]
MRLLFVRHGESDANIARIISNRDLPHRLTALGIAQATTLAERLVGQPVTAIWSSPIPRAQETAAIVSARLGLPVITAAALCEFDCGPMEGRGDEEAWAAHHAVTQAWDEKHDYDCRIEPNGESFHEMSERFLPFISDLLAQEGRAPGDILLITHGALLHLMLPLVLANIDRAFTKQHPLANCDLVIVLAQNGQLVCSHWGAIQLS